MRSIPFGRPVIGEAEKEAVAAVLDSGILVHGPKLAELEAAFAHFTGASRAVGVSSCTAGLHLAYWLLGIGPGDEVIVPAQTHAATAHAVELTGATVVFVDAEPAAGNIDLDLLETAITPRTKAISVVHYLGMPVDMRRVNVIAKANDLNVVEDCALALGAYLNGTHVGLFGTLGCFSFYPVKHMTTGEGGMVTTNDHELAERFALQRAFGVDRHHGVRQVPGEYDVVALGYNYRMSEIHAAIGVEQMNRLPDFLKARDENYGRLSVGLRRITGLRLLQSSHDEFRSGRYCHAFILEDRLARRRPEVMMKLKDRGIGTSVYYPGPVPLMTYYREKYGFSEGDFPVAAEISRASIALPVGPHLEPADIDYMIAAVAEVIDEMRAR